ncbi:uncharacterized protein UDID_17259 [Ustilago sp. UG-2017a]|nr:uncharacterized protein UDID_17259 [Ustilago sp. UG-2017a]
MVQETEAQAVASKVKGGRKGKATQPRVADNEATNESDTEAIDDNANEEIDSDSDHDNDGKQYNFRTLAKLLEPVPKLTSHNYYSWSAHIKSFLRCVPHAMKHLDGAYDKKHPKWNRTFDDALTNALCSTIDTTGEFNINYLILDIIREHHTFHNEDFGDLRYTDENLFDEREEEALQEYMDMDNVDETDGGQTSDKVAKEAIEHKTIANRWNDNKLYGFMTTNDNERKNLDPTISKALSGEDKKHWEEAMRKELDRLKAMGTWEVADLPKGMNTVDTHWVLKIKTDANLIPTKFKARLVAWGFTQREGIDYTEVFAPVAPIQSIQGVLAMATVRDWEVDCVDVKQAYLNSTLHHSIFLKPPLGMKVTPGKALKLMKGLYGLKQSGREWNMELDSHLRKIGFYCMPSAPCLYSRGTGDSMTIITAYVDDMLITSPSRTEVSRTKDEIMAKWGTEDKGPVKEFLGVRIDRDRIRRRMTLDLTAYIKAMVRKWLQTTDLKSWVPMQSLTGVTGGDKCNSLAAKQYQELVGQLLWISNTARPDISFTVGTLARYMSSPTSNAWKAALHLVKYLNQTSEYKLLFGDEANKHSGQQIVTYTDANWASDPTNRQRSTSGGVTYVYGCPVSWRSHVQKCVALSAVKAEFVAASEAAREALFFSYLLRDLGVEAHPPTLRTDSQGCIQVSKDPTKHWKLKHIDTRYHFVRDHVQEGEVKIDFVGTTDNVADILMKPLKGLATSRITRLMGLTMPSRGRVEDVSTS